jgi:HK97 family phage prohead protease
MTELETRSVELRADVESGTVEGIAVPWNTRTEIPYPEYFERGAISDAGNIKLFWQHDQIIGRVIDSEDREEGFWIKAQISDTSAGRDARALLRDGAVDKFSVGFLPVSQREEKDETIVRTGVDLKEVSAVTWPAYESASITEAREAATHIKENTMADQPDYTADLAEVRDSLENLDRRFEVLSSRPSETTPVADTRSAGEFVKAVAAGDSDAIETLNRAYSGATTTDSVLLPQWIGDLTKLVNNPSPLRNIFSNGTLPSSGNVLEYGKLKSDTTQVAVQANEGDNLVYGKVQVDTATASVVTAGGYSTLSRQAIERSSVNYIDTVLQAQANAAARYLDANFRADYIAEVAAQTSAGNTVTLDVTSTSYMAWLDGIIDAAGTYQDRGMTLDGLIVDKAAFKALAHLSGSDGRPLFSVNGGGQAVNTVGNLNLTGLTGSIANVTVVLDAKLNGNVAFFNSAALREYRSPLVRLQDDNIINLSRDYSIYTYVAIAHEAPNGIVPVKKASA